MPRGRVGTRRGMTHGRYSHEWLKSPTSEIRLLSLDTADETYPLSCILRSHELKSCPPYIALSYEWGEVEPQVQIMVNGLYLRIRHNLFLFLSLLKARQRRGSLSKDLLYWIDAICIDQEDLSERNVQVAMMGIIYHKAESVFDWSGWPQCWNPELTFGFIQQSSCPVDVGNDSRERSIAKNILWELTYSEVSQMILQMCSCRYWSRRWIVQEILLARDVTIMCGENGLSWTALNLFAQRLRRLAALLLPHQSSIIQDLEMTIPFKMSRYRHAGTNGEPRCLLSTS